MTDNKPLPPFSLRLSSKERADLDVMAAGAPWGSFIRFMVFESPDARQRDFFRATVKDQQALSLLLSEFGKSRISNNVNQLAKAIHAGALPVTPETEKAVMDACIAIDWMRQQMIAALGLMPDDGKP